MGVDISIRVKLYSSDTEFKEVTVTEQDNSLGGLLTNNDISYTSIHFRKDTELSPDENQLLTLLQDEEDEMIMKSKILDSNEIVLIMEKMYRLLNKKKRVALDNDLKKINELNIDEEEKIKKRTYAIGEYFDFENSFSKLHGILKAAQVMGCKVQLIAFFY